jgi:hypothetical protein
MSVDLSVAECNRSDILQQGRGLFHPAFARHREGSDKRSGVYTHFDHNMKEEKISSPFPMDSERTIL